MIQDRSFTAEGAEVAEYPIGVRWISQTVTVPLLHAGFRSIQVLPMILSIFRLGDLCVPCGKREPPRL